MFAACLALIDDGGGWMPDCELRGVGCAMLGAFALGFAAQAFNEWDALLLLVWQLNADQRWLLDGVKTACLRLLVLPK